MAKSFNILQDQGYSVSEQIAKYLNKPEDVAEEEIKRDCEIKWD